MRSSDRVWTIGDGNGWAFLNGRWTAGPDAGLLPPDGFDIEYVAVNEAAVYGDFAARFRFKFRCVGGSARFLFRVQDARRFYALDIPVNGQQFRARHFWAGIVLADGTPLQRYLSFGLVPGLGARLEHWYEARVEAQGRRLRAWIDDIPVADVEDGTYAAGRLGLAAIVNPYLENAHFTALTVAGTPLAPTPWPGLETPKPHW